jgi:hypothetical protein
MLQDVLTRLGLQQVNSGVYSGEWIARPAGEELVSYNPATGEPIARVRTASRDDYDRVVEAARRTFEQWRTVPPPVRGEVVRRFGLALREHKRDLGLLVTLENGKIRTEGEGEVQEMIDMCDFSVGLSRQLYGLTIASEENVQGVTEFKRVFDAGVMPIGDDAATFRSKFQENSLGFIIDNSGAALSFATAGAAITGQDMVSAPLPFPEAGAHQKLIVAVNTNSDNVDLAKDFIRWFVTEEGQTLIRPPLGASTLATDVPLPDEFIEEHPWAETYVDIGLESRPLLIAGFEMDTMDYYQTIMEAVERVITQDQDPREALEQAQAALE